MRITGERAACRASSMFKGPEVALARRAPEAHGAEQRGQEGWGLGRGSSGALRNLCLRLRGRRSYGKVLS